MVDLKGWFHDSHRHALAARGVTTRFDPASRISRNGFIYIQDDGDRLGWTDIYVDERSIARIYGDGAVPSGTAIMVGIRVYDQHQRTGYGRKLLEASEEYARDLGMKRIWAMSVVNERFFKMNGYERIDPGKRLYKMVGTIYEKVL